MSQSPFPDNLDTNNTFTDIHGQNQDIEREINKIYAGTKPTPDRKSIQEKLALDTKKKYKNEKRQMRKILLILVLMHNIVVYGLVIATGITGSGFLLDPTVLFALIASCTSTAVVTILNKASNFAFNE